MIIHNFDIMSDASEVVHYDNAKIPLYVRRGILSTYPDYRAIAHWHEDLEFIGIEEGEMYYSINGESILLSENDSLFVNSRQLHYGYADGDAKKECIFLCILVHPSLLFGANPLLLNDLSPMLNDPSFPCFHFSGTSDQAERVRGILKEVYKARQNNHPGYRLEASGLLTALSGILVDLWQERKASRILPSAGSDEGLDLQRRMVAFIEGNYPSDLTLDKIAESASLSRSTCCRLFRRYVHTSPLSFLNSYRLQVSCEMLRSSEKSITEISALCGFNNASYYTHLFTRSYGCTPRAYRKAQANARK